MKITTCAAPNGQGFCVFFNFTKLSSVFMLTVLFLRYFDVIARPALEDSTTAGVQAVLLAATVRSPFLADRLQAEAVSANCHLRLSRGDWVRWVSPGNWLLIDGSCWQVQ